MVGLPGFEPESIEPKSTSLDQASRQPLDLLMELNSSFSRTTLVDSRTVFPSDPLLLLATPKDSSETFKFC